MSKVATRAVLLLAVTGGPWSAQDRAERMNVVLLIIDDARWDSLGVAGNRIVRTPRIDRLAQEGVHFAQARVTTSICMVSRATLLTGQYMSRHGIDAFGRAIAPDAFANTFPAVLRRAGYWAGYVGKYGVGPPRAGDFDFLRAYEGTHWMTASGGERIHVTEKNARDAIDFLEARPKDQPFSLTVGFFAAHAEDKMQGTDLSPLYLAATPPAWRDAFFYEHPTITSKDRIPSSQGAIRKDWKHIEWPEFDHRQLFDLENDPGERRRRGPESASAC
jgi:arylsulfatase A-like enzyme